MTTAEVSDRLARNGTLLAFWVVVVLAVAASIPLASSGWDVRVYVAAIRSLRLGHDPYADAMAIQRIYHSQSMVMPNGDPPYSYVYSPITLPLLRLIGGLPNWLSGSVYWLLYVAGVLGQMLFALRFTTGRERRIFLYLAPVSAFFPGMLVNGTILGGNIAYILYPAVLLCAVQGWRRGNWTWFYAAALAASCVKAPMLSLVAIPALSARKQWGPAAVTAVAGVALFVVQPLLWPAQFQNYLQAVDLQFLYNRDFGCSPAGLLSDALYAHGVRYQLAGLLLYLAYAIPLLALLWSLSRRFLKGEFPLREWIPVLLVGVILLNPRIMEYDVAPISLLLTIVAWRFFSRVATAKWTILCMALLVTATNGVAAFGWYIRKLVDGPLLIAVFAMGCWMLLPGSETAADEPDYALAAAGGLN